MKITLNLVFIFFMLNTGFKPQTGDLLFQDIDCGPLCDAIEQVTSGIGGGRFSHVALFVEKDSGYYVLEAVSSGVKYTPYMEFLARSKDASGNPKVIVGRLKNDYRPFIPTAIANMEKYIGKPYDTVFCIDNEAYYCSELIYFGFKEATGGTDLFELNPMTFKAPGKKGFFPEWEKYFEGLGVGVPEGQPGLNPGGISKSDKIEIVHIYGYPDGYEYDK